MIKIPNWAVVPVMTEAIIHANKLVELNNFQKLTNKQQQQLASLVVKRVDKIKSKKQLNNLINSTTFDQIVYQELATVYTA